MQAYKHAPMADEELLEGELVREALRMRDEALRAREEAEERILELEKENGRLLAQTTEALRETEKLRARVSAADDAAKERERALERRYEELVSSKNELHGLVDLKSDQLIRSNALSRQLDMSYAKLKRTHAEVLQENERAKEVLALERTVAHYKERKEKECREWDARLQKAQLECEQRMQNLMSTWESQNRKYAAEMQELQGQYDELQSKYEHKRSVAERELDYQISLKQKAVEEAEDDSATKIAELSTEMQQKTLQLRTQILQNQKQVRENATATRRKMEAQIEEISTAYKAKVSREKAEADELVRFEREKVRQAAEDRATWEARVRKLERSYKGHAAKTAVLVHSLDMATRQDIARVHSDALCG